MIYLSWSDTFIISNQKYTKDVARSCVFVSYMAQAHETGTSQVGGPKLAKVFYGRIV